MAFDFQKVKGAMLHGWSGFAAWPYSALLLGVLCLAPIYLCLIPAHYYTDDNNARALGLSFLCGALVGLTEIASRYRDEQVKAITSPDGMVYILFNGAISTFALILILHFQNNAAFIMFRGNAVGAAIAAGFGATAIMRTRLAVIKGSDNKDISIGPDIVINLLMTMIDRRIDRWRSLRRQQIIAERFDDLKNLGSIDDASEYLLGSIVSFQNISEAERKEVNALIEQNKANPNIHDVNIKFTSLGYIFLTLVGEENFAQVLREAKKLQGAQSVPATGISAPPVNPPSTPLVGIQPPPVPPGASPPKS
jgi:hypothetical protein